MSRLLLALCVGAHLTLGGAAVLTAQDGSYDENALRVEGHQGDLRIVRGARGTLVVRISGFRTTDVAKLVAPSEHAMAEARIFSRDYIPGSWIAGLGIATMGAAIGASRINDLNRVIPTGLTIGAAALLIYGGGRLQNAYNALARSIWWYNRDLKN
ncbi:MAG: hypothetical protein ACR2NS_11800 [Gemmatimonadaceae bacterium]